MNMRFFFVWIIFLFTFSGCTFVFSDIGYQENIKTEAYLLKQNQLIETFSPDNRNKPRQLNYSEINDDPYLLLRFKNIGNKRPFSGLVTCHININRSFDINIHGLGFGEEWTTYVIQLTDLVLPIKGSEYYTEKPEFRIEWEKLYVK